MASGSDPTYPHDYRFLFSGRPPPTIAGGQAVNLWALYLLAESDPDIQAANLSSKDLDIVADKAMVEHLRTIPGWFFKPREIWNFADSRQGMFFSTAPDGRKLLVEILHKVHGLDRADYAHAVVLEHEGTEYRVLDPICMLKAKGANVRDIKQDDVPPRHDREHLRLIARCVPLYLRELHELAVLGKLSESDALSPLTRTFKILQDRSLAATLAAEGIAPRSIIPHEFSISTLPRIQRAYTYQMPLAERAAEKPGIRPSL